MSYDTKAPLFPTHLPLENGYYQYPSDASASSEEPIPFGTGRYDLASETNQVLWFEREIRVLRPKLHYCNGHYVAREKVASKPQDIAERVGSRESPRTQAVRVRPAATTPILPQPGGLPTVPDKFQPFGASASNATNSALRNNANRRVSNWSLDAIADTTRSIHGVDQTYQVPMEASQERILDTVKTAYKDRPNLGFSIIELKDRELERIAKLPQLQKKQFLDKNISAVLNLVTKFGADIIDDLNYYEGDLDFLVKASDLRHILYPKATSGIFTNICSTYSYSEILNIAEIMTVFPGKFENIANLSKGFPDFDIEKAKEYKKENPKDSLESIAEKMLKQLREKSKKIDPEMKIARTEFLRTGYPDKTADEIDSLRNRIEDVMFDLRNSGTDITFEKIAEIYWHDDLFDLPSWVSYWEHLKKEVSFSELALAIAVNENLWEKHIHEALRYLPGVPLPEVALAFWINPHFDIAEAAELLRAQPGASLDMIAKQQKRHDFA